LSTLRCRLNNAGAYSTHQFLQAISHSLGAQTTAFDVVLNDSDADDDDQQQQPQPQQQPPPKQNESTGSSTSQVNDTQSADTSSLHVLALPSCHAAILDSVPIVQRLSAMDSGCSICRSPITMVLHVFKEFN